MFVIFLIPKTEFYLFGLSFYSLNFVIEEM